MEPIYQQIRERARQITATFPAPALYGAYPLAFEHSRGLITAHPTVRHLHLFVAEHLEDDFGHGLQHAVKVAVDAGMLMNIECARARRSRRFTDRRMLVVQCAALLHDIRRKHPDHAVAGAEAARQILKQFSLSAAEVEDICLAIRNHEAFKPTTPVDTFEGCMVSDCLYDADKLRWGPDNFLVTIWDMVSYFNIPLAEFIRRYPKGIQGLAEIKKTFRTPTGKKYGPEFIDIGLAIGTRLQAVIQTEFAAHIQPEGDN